MATSASVLLSEQTFVANNDTHSRATALGHFRSRRSVKGASSAIVVTERCELAPKKSLHRPHIFLDFDCDVFCVQIRHDDVAVCDGLPSVVELNQQGRDIR